MYAPRPSLVLRNAGILDFWLSESLGFLFSRDVSSVTIILCELAQCALCSVRRYVDEGGPLHAFRFPGCDEASFATSSSDGAVSGDSEAEFMFV